jgi:hypothetical protein
VGGFAVRPKTIIYFERIIFGILLLSALHNYLVWDQIIGQAIAEDAMLDRNTAVAIAITAIIFNYVLVGTLTLLVSRRRSKIAMWLLITQGALVLSLTALGIIQARRLLASDIVWEALESIGQVVAYALLFTSSARRWMNREDEKNERLSEVFH